MILSSDDQNFKEFQKAKKLGLNGCYGSQVQQKKIHMNSSKLKHSIY